MSLQQLVPITVFPDASVAVVETVTAVVGKITYYPAELNATLADSDTPSFDVIVATII